jgi:putative two-component system response regulator
MARALRKAGFPEPLCVSDALQAADEYRRYQPEVLLLDLKLPPVDGFYVLEQLSRIAPEEKLAPVIMITGDAPEETKRRALEAGVADFIYKQADLTEMVLRTRNVLHMHRLYVELDRRKEWLEERVRERTRELEQAQRETLDRLALAAEFRDDQTGEHTKRVAAISAQIAEEIGLPPEFVRDIGSAALLHDLGKIGVPDAILLHPGPLRPDEYDRLKNHTLIGARVLEGCAWPVLQMARDIAVGHHEHWNGSGYPFGRKHEEIPLAARIVSVADAYDAITSARPYKPALGIEEALDRIKARSGLQFDPAIVSAFEAIARRELVDGSQAYAR